MSHIILSLSIIIPVFNESAHIVANLGVLRNLVGEAVEIIVVDGGSTDDTLLLAQAHANKVISSRKGRALQMNEGAQYAQGDYVLFLHIDTQLPQLPVLQLFPFLSSSLSPLWGFYLVRLSGRQWTFRIIERCINLRSWITSVATGDQCLFMLKADFTAMGGFAEIPLMEDVEFSKRLRRQQIPMVVNVKVVTSSRRWEKNGTLKTVVLMWYLRALYYVGVSPSYIVKKYYK